MKLLVVEDEALLRHHLQTRLTESGHVVEAVANAEEALYQTEQFNHDLAMIDLGLPGLGGLELIRQLRAVVVVAVAAAVLIPGRSKAPTAPGTEQTQLGQAAPNSGAQPSVDFAGSSQPMPLPLVGQSQPVMRDPLARQPVARWW